MSRVRLRALALEAQTRTEGEWCARSTYVYRTNDPRDHRQVCRVPAVQPDERIPHPIAAYIAEACPTKVIALLDELEESETDLEDTLSGATWGRMIEAHASLVDQLKAMTMARDDLAQVADELLTTDPYPTELEIYAIRIRALRKVGG